MKRSFKHHFSEAEYHCAKIGHKMILNDAKQPKDFKSILDKYPNVVDIYKELSEELKQYQTIKRKNIQKILNCSDSDADIFINYFVNNELLEKQKKTSAKIANMEYTQT